MSEVTRPANAERGEIVLKLEGEDYVLRPSHEAIMAFEELTGRGLYELATDAINRKLRLTETAQIATECIRAWGRATGTASMQQVNARRVGELMLEGEGGFKAAVEAVGAMLALACTGGYTAQGEQKAAATMTETKATPAAA
jgi:hypothetical protein